MKLQALAQSYFYLLTVWTKKLKQLSFNVAHSEDIIEVHGTKELEERR